MKCLLYICLLSVTISCSVLKPKYTTEIQHDTTIIYKNNNIYQHDSVYVYKDRNIYIKGDTVYTTITEYKDRWKIKEVHDTAYKYKSVFVDRDVPVEVEKELRWFQKLFIVLGKVFLALLLCYLIARFLIR